MMNLNRIDLKAKIIIKNHAEMRETYALSILYCICRNLKTEGPIYVVKNNSSIYTKMCSLCSKDLFTLPVFTRPTLQYMYFQVFNISTYILYAYRTSHIWDAVLNDLMHLWCSKVDMAYNNYLPLFPPHCVRWKAELKIYSTFYIITRGSQIRISSPTNISVG